MNESITLHTFAMSPFAAKTHAFLLFKGLSFECHYVNPLRLYSGGIPIGHMVPVLSIGDEHRADSTPIGMWLDERYDDRPTLVPDDDRERVLAHDRWVTERLIPNHFRTFPGVGVNRRRIRNAWRLAKVLHLTTAGGVPKPVRMIWPAVLWGLPFLQRERSNARQELDLDTASNQVLDELVELLDGGPFFGGRSTPAMGDLSAYAVLLTAEQAGLAGSNRVDAFPEIVSWMDRVGAHLAPSPPLIPRSVRTLPPIEA